MGTLGVGIIGAGPVTQAIHLPALARLGDLFTVRRIMDIDPGVARTVAARVGAAPAGTVAEVLEDPAVDVVAICSPHAFHADQTILACQTGKRAVLTEKPFTESVADAERVAAVSRATGVPVMVGTMHLYDPGWRAAFEAWGTGPATTIRSSVVLPPNPRMEDFATEVTGRPPAAPPSGPPTTEQRARSVHGGLMGLAIHNIPHVRALLPAGALVVADAVALPHGYHVAATYGECQIEWQFAMYDTWRPDWVFEAYAPHKAMHVQFTPSYVQAGSASATVTTPQGTTTVRPAPDNGYVAEWRELARVARGDVPPPDPDGLVADLALALTVADAAAAFVRGGQA